MKKSNVLFFIIACFVSNHSSGQNSSTLPLLEGKIPVYSHLLNSTVFRLFDSTHSNGLVFIKFTISETGLPGDIGFSKNFPEAIKTSVIESIQSTKGKWKPASLNSLSISKTLLLPIAFQYKKDNDYSVDLSLLIESFKIETQSGENIRNIDAILLPVCLTGWAVR